MAIRPLRAHHHRWRTIVCACLAASWLLAPRGAAQSGGERIRDPRVTKILASVSQERLEQLLTRLVAFGTRSTYSPDAPSRGIHAAARWIHDEMRSASPNLQVDFDAYHVPKGGAEGRIVEEIELRNVIAVLPGRSARRIYITAHYDSMSRGAGGEGDAPGANDNGSGTALLMEAARVLAASGIPFDATIVFMATAGEEEGLVGARLHAARARENSVVIQAVLNSDIVGGIRGEDGTVDAATVRLYSADPDDSPSRALARFTKTIAERYLPAHRIQLLARPDRVMRSGDHVAFSLAGIAAVGFREARENYSRQHNATDTLDTVSIAYLAQNTRANIAAAASLAIAPPPPILEGMSTSPPWANMVTLRWRPSERAYGYRLYWREAWGQDWQQHRDVGNVTEYAMPRALADEAVFGVAALGIDGHESTIAAYQQ